MSLIKANGAGDQSTGFYSHLLDQSLRFHTPDNTYLTRTITSAGNRKKATFSFWVKQNSLDASTVAHVLYDQGDNNGTNHFYMLLYQDNLYINDYDYGSSGSPGSDILFQTTRKFRDTSAWTHFVVRIDTTQSTEADRVRIYINGGDPETAFTGSTAYPSQNADLHVLNNTTQSTGVDTSNVRIGYHNSHYSDCYMAEYNYCDGQSLGPDSFGQFRQGIWTPKDTSGLTFGTNGFHLTFKDDVVSEGFNTVTYRGNNGSGTTGQSISGVGFKPAFIWIKNRDTTTNPVAFDYVRGNQLWLETSSTDADQDSTTYGVQSHDADGWTMGGGNDINRNGEGHAAWCWEAGGEPTANNSAGTSAVPTANSAKVDGSNHGSALSGSIAFTRASANTTKGFSVITYTGNGSAGATVDHLLGDTPDWYIVKRRDSSASWQVFHTSLGATKFIDLQSSGAAETNTNRWNDTAPTSSVVSLGTNSNVNSSGGTYVMYCWAGKSGYSAFGSYTGNGGSQAIDVGFNPAWVMLRRTNGSTWGIFDNTRQTARNHQMLAANSTAVETTNSTFTFSGNTFNDNGYLSDSGTTVLYMAFADTREAAFFKDVTSNGNHFTPVNLDYRHSVPDVPTNNFATMMFDPPAADINGYTLTEGALTVTGTNTGQYSGLRASMNIPSTGKWYAEFLCTNVDAGSSGNGDNVIGLTTRSKDLSNNGFNLDDVISIVGGGNLHRDLSGEATVNGVTARQTTGDIIQFAVDADSGKVYIGENNTYYAADGGSDGNPSGGSNQSATLQAADFEELTFFLMVGMNSGYTMSLTANFGQDPSFSGRKSMVSTNSDANGRGSFQYAPPTDFLALCSQNLPDVDIIDGTEHFETLTYGGSGSSQGVTGLSFSPDWVWIKNRSRAGQGHVLHDTVRGNDGAEALLLQTDSTAAETHYDNFGVTTFDSGGFTVVGNGGLTNYSGDTFVAWNWLAGTAFSNDASATGVGTIDSDGQVNTTAGFSIIKWTANNSVATIAHGLGAVPSMYIMRDRDGGNWWVYHKGIASDAETDYLLLESNGAAADYTVWNDTAPTSTVFSVGSSSGNNSNENNIGYFFSDIEGYLKAGSYVGNANSDGPFVYTGGRVQWLLLKNASASENWYIWDNAREPINIMNERQHPNLSLADQTSSGRGLDFLSNGFKIRGSDSSVNGSGNTIIYLAIMEQPFKFANAR